MRTISSAWAVVLAFAPSVAQAANVGGGTAPYSTPAGITIVDISNDAQKFSGRRIGDADGNPLFAIKADASGKAACAADCAKDFAPFVAGADAAAYDVWSLVPTETGAKQWAYQGQPLYRYIGKESQVQAASAKSLAKTPFAKLVEFRPENTIPAPAGIKLESLEVAAGYGLVNSETGAVMYTLAGAPKNPMVWRPVYAPSAALPVGDFAITKREDATLQWSYKGKPLYTFREDYSPGDVNGVFADPSAQVALAYRHFVPAAVQVEKATARGPMMVTADGKTVYTEGQYRLQYGGRSTRDGYYLAYDNAKAVGTKGCVDDCLKMWRPVVAPANAQPRGLWEITTRPDGARQWVYKGAPLYTYAGDKKFGDINGNNRHIAVYGDPQGKSDISAAAGEAAGGTGYDRGFGSGYYWHYVMLYTQYLPEKKDAGTQ